MNETRVIHVNDMPNHPDAVYIGRANGRRGLKASPLANPYVVGKDGELSEVIEKYRAWTEDMITDAPISFGIELSLLVGKPLACWCRRDGEDRTPENACHGDVIIQILEELGLEGEAKS